MAMRDEDFGTAPTLTESDGGLWSLPMAAPASEPHDWQSLYEQAQARAETERVRADAAEARVQELLNDIRRLRTSLRKTEVGKGARGPVPRNNRGAHEVTTGQPLRALDRSQEQRDEIAALRRKVAALRRLKRPATAAPSGLRSRRRRNGRNRRRTRSYAPAAASPMSPTASVPRRSSRSRSRPTSAGSSVRATAGAATAHPRPWRRSRPRRRGCSPGRPSGSASGRASFTSASPASGPCARSRRG